MPHGPARIQTKTLQITGRPVLPPEPQPLQQNTTARNRIALQPTTATNKDSNKQGHDINVIVKFDGEMAVGWKRILCLSNLLTVDAKNDSSNRSSSAAVIIVVHATCVRLPRRSTVINLLSPAHRLYTALSPPTSENLMVFHWFLASGSRVMNSHGSCADGLCRGNPNFLEVHLAFQVKATSRCKESHNENENSFVLYVKDSGWWSAELENVAV